MRHFVSLNCKEITQLWPVDSTIYDHYLSCLIFSPAFIAAGVYLTLKHIDLTFEEKKSRIQAKFYTWTFISCDFLSLMLQAVGGGFAGGTGNNVHLRNIRTGLTIAGIVWQVATSLVFLGLVVDYTLRTINGWDQVPQKRKVLAKKMSFRCYVGSVTAAFITIFYRSVYRIAKMTGGWAKPTMNDETGFAVMKGLYIFLLPLVLEADTLQYDCHCCTRPHDFPTPVLLSIITWQEG